MSRSHKVNKAKVSTAREQSNRLILAGDKLVDALMPLSLESEPIRDALTEWNRARVATISKIGL